MIFVKGNNNNQAVAHDSQLGQVNNRITSAENKNDNKSGFFGTFSAFSNFVTVSRYKTILEKYLTDKPDELFAKGYEVTEQHNTKQTKNFFVNLNVGYKSKNANGIAYKSTETKDKNKDKNNENTTKETVDIFLPVVLDENIEQSIEECARYNKLIWANLSGKITKNNDDIVSKEIKSFWGKQTKNLDQDELEVYRRHQKDFKNTNCKLEDFKNQCEFYSALIDEFIKKHHLKPPERKRAALIFFWTLALIAIVFWSFCVFATTFSISVGVWLGISKILVCKIIYGSQVWALFATLFFWRVGKYISWKQNDYEEPFTIKDNQNQDVINEYPESYSKYNEELKRHKIGCVGLTGEQFKTEEFEHNYNEEEAKQCPLYNYYHDEKGELKKNTKTPLKLLLELKKAYEIPKQFKNTKSKAYDVTNNQMLN